MSLAAAAAGYSGQAAKPSCPCCKEEAAAPFSKESIYQLDARFTRTMLTIRERLRARFIAEANNLLNRENITSLKTTATVDANGVAASPGPFAYNSTVLEKRIIQFGVKVDW